ncbi:MBL fold metallo-hydrolase [Saccharopolyspora elongata]|uniref:MBL fold metallo-hydrolase n=1 Tax=Saccharopolyspora elongata TaxID=2530387 RepID=A0A4R4Z1L6_9PSEU|nr:MBL fold metallo-hydrolase [Saccharopolyspora elongata]TDD51656.1 MBL fold metallo-hydrolase [Saccharopolyspora elongata]
MVLDFGYASFPALLRHCGPERVDAVLISHGHPDHVADLSPFLRARAFRRDLNLPPVPLYAPSGALDAVLGLDREEFVGHPYTVHVIDPPHAFDLGPFRVRTVALPHYEPNIGFRISAGGITVAYTGDTGPAEELVELAEDADLFLAQAMYTKEVPERDRGNMCSAVDVGELRDQGRRRGTHADPPVLDEERHSGGCQSSCPHGLPGTDHRCAQRARLVQARPISGLTPTRNRGTPGLAAESPSKAPGCPAWGCMGRSCVTSPACPRRDVRAAHPAAPPVPLTACGAGGTTRFNSAPHLARCPAFVDDYQRG